MRSKKCPHFILRYFHKFTFKFDHIQGEYPPRSQVFLSWLFRIYTYPILIYLDFSDFSPFWDGVKLGVWCRNFRFISGGVVYIRNILENKSKWMKTCFEIVFGYVYTRHIGFSQNYFLSFFEFLSTFLGRIPHTTGLLLFEMFDFYQEL